jgi:hypothetical protein
MLVEVASTVSMKEIAQQKMGKAQCFARFIGSLNR